MASPRTSILEAYRARVHSKWGPGGTRELRKVERRQWMPGGTVLPIAWIVDDGCRRMPGEGDFESETLTLNWKLVLEIGDTFDRKATTETWEEFVEGVWRDLHNYIPAGHGVLRTRYVADDPFDAVLQSGDTRVVWVIEFETIYAVEVGEMEAGTVPA
jgi:hypothetical protein